MYVRPPLPTGPPRAASPTSSSGRTAPDPSQPYDALIDALLPLAVVGGGKASSSAASAARAAAATGPPPALRAAWELAERQQQDAEQQVGQGSGSTAAATGWVLASSTGAGDYKEESSPSPPSPSPPPPPPPPPRLLEPLTRCPTLVLGRIAQLEQRERDRARKSQIAALGQGLSALVAERDAREAARLLAEASGAADSRRRWREWREEGAAAAASDSEGLLNVAVGGRAPGGAPSESPDPSRSVALDDLYRLADKAEGEERARAERAARDAARLERAARREALLDPSVADELRRRMEEAKEQIPPAPPLPTKPRPPPPAPAKIAPELGAASFFKAAAAGANGSGASSSSTSSSFAQAAMERFGANAGAMAAARVRARLANLDEEKRRRLEALPSVAALSSLPSASTFEARAVLRHLLREATDGRDERAALLPEACTAPGMLTRVDDENQQQDAPLVPLRTTPPALRLAAEERLRELGASSPPMLLPSGEDEREALQELLEDLNGYERVWRAVDGGGG